MRTFENKAKCVHKNITKITNGTYETLIYNADIITPANRPASITVPIKILNISAIMIVLFTSFN
jgi:hypothetical protein